MQTSAQFDVIKFEALDSIEKKQLYIFQFLSILEKEKELTNLNELLLISNYINNQVLRRLISRCFLKFKKNILSDLLEPMQKTTDNGHRITLTHSVGEIVLFKKYNFQEPCYLFQKYLLKAKTEDISQRFEILNAIKGGLKGAGHTISELVAKELFKIAKSGLTDKFYIIRLISAKLMKNIYKFTKYPKPVTMMEYETIITSLLKTQQPQDQVRTAISSLIAAILSLPPPVPQATPSTPSTQAKQIPITILEILTFLPKFYQKAIPESRPTVIESFEIYFQTSGIDFNELHYPQILNQCIELILAVNNQETQTSISQLLRKVGKLLSESGQLRGCRTLIKKTEVQCTITLNLVLSELGCFLTDLGPAALSIQEDVNPILELITRKELDLIALPLASCIRDLTLSIPNLITTILNKVLILLQFELKNADGGVSYAYIISAVIGIVKERPLFAAYEDLGTIFGIAIRLIKTTGKQNHGVIGWTLVGALMTLGPNFVSVHISQVMLSWQSVFSKTPKEIITRVESDWMYVLYIKDAALAALLSFLKNNSVSEDYQKRVILLLNNTLGFLNTLPGQFDPLDERLPTKNQVLLYERECLVKARVFECLRVLGKGFEGIYTTLIRSLVDTFALNPDKSDRFLATLTKEGGFFGKLSLKDAAVGLVIESVQLTSLTSSLIATGDDQNFDISNINIHDKVLIYINLV
jgi:hypothetical protein